VRKREKEERKRREEERRGERKNIPDGTPVESPT
jgi:hypothetical protein